jgi:capsular polysaccharide export protein
MRLPEVDAVAGWGRKATALRSWRRATKLAKPYVSFEDGFLRSVLPGGGQLPVSLLVDWTGVHYDATGPSDLETLIGRATQSPSFDTERRAREGMARLKSLALSKYNAAPKGALPGLERAEGRRPRVLVVDQTHNDASIRYGLAERSTFAAMLRAARRENPEADIWIKWHPEVVCGRKRGYLTEARGERIHHITAQVNPWELMAGVDRVYVVTSQMGFEAMLAGRGVSCFGAPFYAGWGLTDDRVPIPRRTARPSLEQLFGAVYFDYAGYACPYEGKRISFEQALDRLAFFRDRFVDNQTRSVCINISRWKRGAVEPLLDGIGGPPQYARTARGAVRKARKLGGRVVTWGMRSTSQLEHLCALADVPLVRIEDGFLRSVGLGAAYTPPLSVCVDRLGIYYDGRTPSELERLLQTAEVDPELMARARRLRAEIVAAGLTKYNVDRPRHGAEVGAGQRFFPAGRTGILVPGQVLDDASVLSTLSSTVPLDGTENFNLTLLRAVRDRNPDAFVVYKPHPDVAAGLRKGNMSARSALRYADRVVTDVSIIALIEQCDRVETLTSLVGFEALLRGKAVTTHGLPFYSGWGLTTDLVTVARRARALTLDELVAITLIRYPRYIHPITLRPCEPEDVVRFLGKVTHDGSSAARRYSIGVAGPLSWGHAAALGLRKMLVGGSGFKPYT